MKNKNHQAVAKPYYTTNRSNETGSEHKLEVTDTAIIQLQQLAKQMERKYPKGYQGL
jgi:hypothetical protein